MQAALSLLQHGGQLYAELDDAGRQLLNLAFFAEIYVGENGVTDVILNQPFRWLAERGLVITMTTDGADPDATPDVVIASGLGGLTDELARLQEEERPVRRRTGAAVALFVETKMCTPEPRS
ncbi:MAG: hypothetical protein H0U26_10260 [Acidimicrobiia bacterium]|nr:hypothetical protein [Acidimicrobiia bacterium]